MLNKHDLQFKRFRQLIDRKWEIEKEIREMPYVELAKPYQKGWECFIVLRDDIKGSSKGELLEKLINIGYKPYRYIRNVSDVKNIRKGLKSLTISKNVKDLAIYNYSYAKGFRRIYTIDYTPEKIHISKKKYESLTAQEQKYFSKEYSVKGVLVGYKLELPNHYFTLKTRPYFITHQKVIDCKLESELGYVNNLITQNQVWRKLYPHKDSYYNYGYKRFKEKRFLQEIKSDLDLYEVFYGDFD